MCFTDLNTQFTYVEEITGGSLQRIEDDKYAEALENFLHEKGVLDLGKPSLPDSEWLYTK
jgi:hypothetical protein